MLGATPAFADEIGDAAKKLADAAYPLLKDVNWNSNLALVKPGSAGAGEWVKAVDMAIVMGAAMDPKLRAAAVEAHHKAIGSASSGVTSKGDFEGIIAGLGRAIASVPESKVMDVYNSFSGVVAGDVPSYLMSTVKEADAKAAYSALMEGPWCRPRWPSVRLRTCHRRARRSYQPLVARTCARVLLPPQQLWRCWVPRPPLLTRS